MTAGLEKVTARRAWFVPGFVVWGLPVWDEIDFLVSEKVGTQETVLYATGDIGGNAQQVSFGDLTDHRGNRLPGTIASPRVIVRQRGHDTAFIMAEESPVDFKIARDPESTGPVMVDLLIVEMGD